MPAATVAEPAIASPARLQSGPEQVRGLPFFSPNAIPALVGEYSLGEARAKVLCTREALVFGPEWRRVSPDPGPGLTGFLVQGQEGVVLALLSPKYCLFVELPADKPALRRFASALESRFSTFFDKAATDAELSFPAWVEFTP
jgi:hypothetical protein